MKHTYTHTHTHAKETNYNGLQIKRRNKTTNKNRFYVVVLFDDEHLAREAFFVRSKHISRDG